MRLIRFWAAVYFSWKTSNLTPWSSEQARSCSLHSSLEPSPNVFGPSHESLPSTLRLPPLLLSATRSNDIFIPDRTFRPNWCHFFHLDGVLNRGSASVPFDMSCPMTYHIILSLLSSFHFLCPDDASHSSNGPIFLKTYVVQCIVVVFYPFYSFIPFCSTTRSSFKRTLFFLPVLPFAHLIFHLLFWIPLALHIHHNPSRGHPS
jgi:hypothetical protein